MKKITFLFALLFSVIAVKAQEINTDQWTFITKTSATWCGNCGSWGWNLFEGLIEDNKDKNVIIWTSHSSGDLENPTAVALNNELGATGQPQFFVNLDRFQVNSGNTNSAKEQMNAYVDDLLFLGAFAGVGVEASYDGDVLSVKGTAEFFTDLEDGNYHLAFYFVKDHLIHNQASQGSMADHRYVLSDRISESTFGDQIVEGAVAEGASYTVEVSKAIADVDLANDEIVAILWNRRNNDGKYVFFNGNRSNITTTSATVDLAGVSDISVRQSDSDLIVDLTTEQNLGNVQSRLINIEGQMIDEQQTNLVRGTNQLKFNTNNLIGGTYLIQITIGGKIYTHKVIIL